MKMTLARSTFSLALLFALGIMSSSNQVCSAPPGGGTVALPKYTIQYLPTLKGKLTDGTLTTGAWSVTYGMNNWGDVVGVSDRGDGTSGPFVYIHPTAPQVIGTMVDLGQLTDQYNGVWWIAQATAINDAGQIVGHGYLPGWPGGVAPVAYRYTPTTGTIGLIDNLSATLPGIQAAGTAINESGDVAGRHYGSGGWASFLWTSTGQGGSFKDLGQLSSGYSTQANAISDRSSLLQKVFAAGTAGTANGDRAWRYDTTTGSMVNLGTLKTTSGIPRSQGFDMNNAGDVTGGSISGRNSRAFVAAPSTSMLDLGTLGGTSSDATCINDSGVVAGNSKTSSGLWRAFVYTKSTGMFALEPQVTGLDTSKLFNGRIYATRINRGGQICGPGGEGFNFNGVHEQAYILTPVP